MTWRIVVVQILCCSDLNLSCCSIVYRSQSSLVRQVRGRTVSGTRIIAYAMKFDYSQKISSSSCSQSFLAQFKGLFSSESEFQLPSSSQFFKGCSSSSFSEGSSSRSSFFMVKMSCQPVDAIYQLQRYNIFQQSSLSPYFFICFRYLFTVVSKGSRSARSNFTYLPLKLTSFYASSDISYFSYYPCSSYSSYLSCSFAQGSTSQTFWKPRYSLIFFLNLSTAPSFASSSMLQSHASLFCLFLLKTKYPYSSISPIYSSCLMLKGSILYPKYQTCFSRSLVAAPFEYVLTAFYTSSLKTLSYSSSSSSYPASFCSLRRYRASWASFNPRLAILLQYNNDRMVRVLGSSIIFAHCCQS